MSSFLVQYNMTGFVYEEGVESRLWSIPYSQKIWLFGPKRMIFINIGGFGGTVWNCYTCICTKVILIVGRSICQT